MENKKIGWLIEGIALAVFTIIIIFNISLKKLTQATCTHGSTCTMYSTMNYQLYLSLAIVIIIASIGLYIMFSKPEEKTIIKKIKQKEKKKKLNLSGLNKKEKKAMELIQKENGVIFQADLKEKLEVGKVGMTRLLDKLEAKQLIERKRRGMNNVVVLIY